MPTSCVICNRQAKFGNFTLKKCTGPSNRGQPGCRCEYNPQTQHLRPEEIHYGYICPGLKFSGRSCMEHRLELGDGAHFERPHGERHTVDQLRRIQQRQNEVLGGCPVDHDMEEHTCRLSKASAHNREALEQIGGYCMLDSDYDAMQADEDQHDALEWSTMSKTLTWVGDVTAAPGPTALSDVLSSDDVPFGADDMKVPISMPGGKAISTRDPVRFIRDSP
jgi:hypothetical protein